jgi:outer membrane protein TolC
MQIRQDVQAALVRLEKARAWQSTYETQLLPRVREGLEAIETLRRRGKGDLLKSIEARRKLLKSWDGYLDALWEIAQAEADLAAAVGDPALPLPSCLSVGQ